MYQSVTFSDFVDAFRSMDRQDQFTYEGKRALFDYLEELEDSTGEPIELDVVALCCEYTEYDSPIEAAESFGWKKPEQSFDYSDDLQTESDDDYTIRCYDEALEWLRDRTIVIEHDSGLIIQDF